MNHDEDRQDFWRVLQAFGISQEAMDRAALIAVYLPIYRNNLMVGESAIHGDGVIAKAVFDEGAEIGPMKLGSDWTTYGRYTNHAKNPNAFVGWEGDTLMCYANRRIVIGEEITVNYRQVRRIIETQCLLNQPEGVQENAARYSNS